MDHDCGSASFYSFRLFFLDRLLSFLFLFRSSDCDFARTTHHFPLVVLGHGGNDGPRLHLNWIIFLQVRG